MTEEALATTETAEPVEQSAEQAPPANDAVANDVAEQPADTPAAAAAEEKKERETALFNRSLKFREEATAKLQKAEQTLAEFRREREAFAKEKAEVAEWRSKMARIKDDPYAWFEAFGEDPADHVRKMVDLQEPTARELARIKRENEEFQKKFEEQEERRKSEAIERGVTESKSTFLQYVQGRSDEYPDVAERLAENPRRVADLFWELASEHHKNTGRAPTIEMVARHMQKQVDDEWQQLEEARAKRASRRQQRGAQPATALSEPGGGNATLQRTAPNGQTANGPGPRTPATLTNRAATSVATALREDATDEEKDEWARREIRRMFAAGTES